MVEYGDDTKGYRLYDATEEKIIYIHGVQFISMVHNLMKRPKSANEINKILPGVIINWLLNFLNSEIEMDDTNQLEQGAKKTFIYS